ncbi:hypothetical protein MC885_015963 [Smutsia gigantea]|nr:hypothetical protein MC885_015963 [Smutsia gigantea]
MREAAGGSAMPQRTVWRGFVLRKKLTTALETINNEESEDEYEEIDLEEFTFNEVSTKNNI